MQQPKIVDLPPRKLMGMQEQMSFSDDKTFMLWKQFRTTLRTTTPNNYTEFYSLQQYPKDFDFTPNTYFRKWAAVKVDDSIPVPLEIEIFPLKGGLYAIFIHKGPANTFFKTSNYIFAEWLPNSEYELDHRAHFEILTPDYKPNDPNAQEEVWIPIKIKK
ncbi:MAG: GyrI-like domain-containing protein [Aureispira sp.]|nr:GyrI-like domain-containing protein [Aureispira sp.]